MGEAVEKFTSQLKRLAKREEIGRQIKSGKGLRQTIEGVKSNLPQIEDQIEQMVNQEYAVDPKRFTLAQNLSQFLRRRFPDIEGFAILPLGSLIRGGAVVRNVLSNDSRPSDIDWGICSDEELNKRVLAQINNFANQTIPEIGKKRGFPGVVSSSYINSENFHAVNLRDSQEALSLILDMGEEGVDYDSWTNPLILYLGPSIPPEINSQNRKHLIEALSELSLRDHSRWENAIHQLADSWKHHVGLKPKHLETRFATSKKDEIMRRDIMRYSREALGKKMEDLLYSTDQSTT